MRISKGEQTTALLEDALAKAAVERTYRDVMSGVRDDRPQFHAMLDFARPGDTSVVWRLDRLGRSLKHLIETVMGLQAREINFRSLTEHIDTSTLGGTFPSASQNRCGSTLEGTTRQRAACTLPYYSPHCHIKTAARTDFTSKYGLLSSSQSEKSLCSILAANSTFGKEYWRSSIFNLYHSDSKSGRFIWRRRYRLLTKHTASANAV
jgi:hypothetical protein